MRLTVLLPIVLTTLLAMRISGAPLPVTLRNGQAYVAASALESETGIVVKRLPGRGEFVACGAVQCAPLKFVITEGSTLLVPVAGVSEAMNLTATFDDNRRHVALVPNSRASSALIGPPRVGAIMPNLRLTRIDGAPVTIDELRGERVLINSWASW